MPFGRGFAAAVVVLLVVFAWLAVTRRLRRERRLLARLRARDAFDAAHGLPLSRLSADERETVAGLTAAGVLRTSGGRCYIEPADLAALRRKRLRLGLAGTIAALAVVALAVFVFL